MTAPVLAVGDGALGFWKAVRDVFPTTKEQRCWWHKSGNTMAAQVIAGSDLEKQIIQTFGTGENMADKFATHLTDAIVGPLDDIKTILAKIARQQFGINLHLNDKNVKKKADDTKEHLKALEAHKWVPVIAADTGTTPQDIQEIQRYLDHLDRSKAVPKVVINGIHEANAEIATTQAQLDAMDGKAYQVYVNVHSRARSPWPDEALQQHLIDPMKEAGFKRVGGAWTLPLEVGTHTNDPTSPKDGRDSHGRQKIAGLDELRKIEQRQLQVLFDIRREIKKGGVGGSGGPHGSLSSTGGSSTGGSSSGGGTGTGTPIPHDLQRQLKDFGIYVKSVQGSMYGNRWVKEMTKALKTPGIGMNEVGLLKQAMRDMAKVTNPKEAHKAADEWRKAARRFSSQMQDDLHKQNEEERKAWMADALAYATHNVPRLPRGHTNISVNHHERHRKREVTLDRKRFTDSAGYEVDYGRGF